MTIKERAAALYESAAEHAVEWVHTANLHVLPLLPPSLQKDVCLFLRSNIDLF